MKISRIIVGGAISILICSCAGAKFKAPEPLMPQQYISHTLANNPQDVINIEWWKNFRDPYLDTIMQYALDSNKNLQVALLKLEKAQLSLRSARAELAPTFGLSLEGTAEKIPQEPLVQKYSIQPTMSWEIDIFGKLRYAAKAARADMMAQEQYYRGVMLTLASDVATSYFTALECDLSLRIAEQTLASRLESAELIGFLYDYGESTEIVMQQTEGLVQSARVAVASYRMARQQAIFSLCELLSCNPVELDIDGRKLLSIGVLGGVPVGLPSSILERRPDILQSYFDVQMAYAEVGVAIANRFPTLTLTGEGGLISSSIGSLFNGKPFGWSAAVELTQPLLSFGTKLRALRIAKLEREESVLGYEQTVVEALGEVEQALVGVRDLGIQAKYQGDNQRSQKVAMELTRELYLVGEGSYLDVLDSQREYFSAQLMYVKLLAQQMSAYVSLYKALGGGW